MKNNKFSYSVRMALVIFACYIGASFITLCVAALVGASGIDLGAFAPFVLIGTVLFACAIIASVMTFVQTRATSKSMTQITEALNKMANGDFSSHLEIKSHERYMEEIAENINKVMAELNSATLLKKDFIRNFSHEFKTPIASIKGFSELLCRDKTLSEEEKEKYYRIICEESTRLSNLAGMTLMLSKLQSQTITPDKEGFFVDEQIEECALLLYGEVERKNLDVQIDVGHIFVYASRELLKELWINLFSNAIKYTNDGGNIKIHSYETTSEHIIAFADDGIGITAEAKKHIFDEYFQENTSRLGNGIGLGLAICKKITDLNGWDISVTSQVGQGSIFEIHIPK